MGFLGQCFNHLRYACPTCDYCDFCSTHKSIKAKKIDFLNSQQKKGPLCAICKEVISDIKESGQIITIEGKVICKECAAVYDGEEEEAC